MIGAHLIATRKVNTLILVHNKQLLEQWKEQLQEFLIINELGRIGCEVIFKDDVYQKFGTIDERVVWYGNIHLLGYG